MTRIRIVLFAMLLFTSGLAQAAVNGTLEEGDFVGTDGSGEFLMDVYNLSLGIDSLVTVTLDAGPTLTPWLYIFNTQAITASSTNVIIDNNWIMDSESSISLDAQIGLSFLAVAGTAYQIIVTSYDYYNGPGDMGAYGDYLLTVDIDPLQVLPAVPLPAGLWLFASALGFIGFVRRRRQS